MTFDCEWCVETFLAEHGFINDAGQKDKAYWRPPHEYVYQTKTEWERLFNA